MTAPHTPWLTEPRCPACSEVIYARASGVCACGQDVLVEHEVFGRWRVTRMADLRDVVGRVGR